MDYHNSSSSSNTPRSSRSSVCNGLSGNVGVGCSLLLFRLSSPFHHCHHQHQQRQRLVSTVSVVGPFLKTCIKDKPGEGELWGSEQGENNASTQLVFAACVYGLPCLALPCLVSVPSSRVVSFVQPACCSCQYSLFVCAGKCLSLNVCVCCACLSVGLSVFRCVCLLVCVGAVPCDKWPCSITGCCCCWRRQQRRQRRRFKTRDRFGAFISVLTLSLFLPSFLHWITCPHNTSTVRA